MEKCGLTINCCEQRLCEELEYSELLDQAAECPGPVERMALVAAFAVSAYAATAHRAASKPFNPLLAETYECVRDDKGFRFIAEQVYLSSIPQLKYSLIKNN